MGQLAQVEEREEYIDFLNREISRYISRLISIETNEQGSSVVSSLFTISGNIERIGDHAADISEIALQFGDEKFIKEPEHIELMAKYAIEMVKDGVQSYVNRDLTLARSLEKRDDKVDELFETVKSDLVALIRADGNNADQAILFMMIAKYLERIADHAVNIGEWVEYAVTGFHKAG